MGATKSDQYSNEIKETARINTVLSHPARLTIIQTLKKQPGLRPTDMMDVIGLRHTATSEHLRKLRSIGVIEFRYVVHQCEIFLVPERLQEAVNFLNGVTEN